MRSAHRWVVAATALGFAACSGGNEVSPPSLDSVVSVPPTADATTTSTLPTSTTASVDTTDVSTTDAPTTTADTGGPVFSDALGVKVDAAPGVNTPGDTRQLLPEGLYVHIAWEPDPDDPSVFTVQPDDVPILEAYANAVRTYYRAAMSTLSTDDPDFDVYMQDGGALFDAAFSQARAANLQLTLGAGVVLRPYVTDRPSPTEALILDCYLQDEEYVVVGSSRAPGELEPKGQIVTMREASGVWQVELAGSEQGACL